VPAVFVRTKGNMPQCGRQIKIPEKSEETACGATFFPITGVR